MARFTLGSMVAAAVMAIGVTANAKAVDEKVDPLAFSSSQAADLKTLTCWEVVTLAEDDRAFAMTLLYGYDQGTKGDANITPRDIQISIITTMQECVDKPDAKVLDILRSHVAHESND